MATETLLQIAERHRAADMLLGGTFGHVAGAWQGRGCSVGCFAHDAGYQGDSTNIHAFVADNFGYPEWMVRLQDCIFEGLPKKDRGSWHCNVAEAIEHVADWGDALHRVHCAILDVALEYAAEATPVVKQVRDLHERRSKDSAAWGAAWGAARGVAYRAAWSAAESAAWSAAWSAVEGAVESAVESAAESAAYRAAWTAAESAAWSAARSVAYRNLASRIIVALKAGSV